LIFEPQVSLSSEIPKFPDGKYFNDEIVDKLNKPDELLFKVYAYKEGADTVDESFNPPLIASIYSKGASVKSKFSDSELMFAHNRFERDVELKPDWHNYVPKCSTNMFSEEMKLGKTWNENYKFVKSSNPSSKCPLGF
jgi:hypothetical protein